MKTDLTKRRSQDLDVASKSAGNPDGKGANGFMLDWYRSEPRGLIAKPQRQVLAELFTSMLVLNAQFKYKPSVGVTNYLYYVSGDWSLSLIGPHEWSSERQASIAGTCVLQQDMTWTISPSELLGEDNPVTEAVAQFYDAFSDKLDTDLTLEEILPFYVGHMPYYQRLYANALSRSLRTTVDLGDRASVSCRQWRKLLPKQEQILLPDSG